MIFKCQVDHIINKRTTTTMLNTNTTFVVAFLAIVFYKLNLFILGYWPIFAGLTLFCCVLYLMKFSLKKNATLVDLPCFYPYTKTCIGRRIISNKIHDSIKSSKCLFCSETNCAKHSNDFKIFKKPWKQIHIESHINDELEKLINTILEENTKFLKDISYNHQQVSEDIRQILKLLLSSLILRIYNKINLKEFLLKQIPKLFFHHFEVYLNGKRKAKNALCLEETVLQNYGTFLHPAIVNQDNEIRYFKSLSSLILETALPLDVMNCDVSSSFLNEVFASTLIAPLVDILTDPDRINTLLIILFDKHSDFELESFDENDTPQMVEFMNGFSPNINKSSDYLLGVEQKELLEDQNLLFLFQQYAKDQEFLNIVQFIINMKSFLGDITNPDLNDYDLKRIFDQFKYIYELFFDENSDQFIEFDKPINEFFKTIVFESLENFKSNIPKLQSSKELYESYDYANNILEYHVDKFHHTDIYLKLICGQRSGGFNFDSHVQFKDDNNRDCLSNDDNEMQSYFEDVNGDKNSTIANNEFNNALSAFTTGPYNGFEMTKCLMDYNVHIVDVNSRYHPLDGEIYLFVIQINDRQRSWTVERQLQDFYNLLSKLKLFHGDQMMSNIQLPCCLPPAPPPPPSNRKSFPQSNRIIMESYRYDLERFLRNLIQYNALQRSELIYNFLSVDFQNLSNDNFNLGKMIKNVPSKFAKERGQHLQTFIKNFINSCEDAGHVVSKPKDNLKGSKCKNFNNFLFLNTTLQNNFSDRSCAQIEYLYDFLLLLLIRFYRITTNWILELLLMVRSLFRRSFQAFVEYRLFTYLEDNIFTPEMVCHLIKSFHVLYLEEGERVGNTEDYEKMRNSMNNDILSMSKSQRSQKALEMLKRFVPSWIYEYFTDKEKHEEVVFLLFSLLQHRLLNKQLLYLLLNSLISDLFSDELVCHVLNKSLDK